MLDTKLSLYNKTRTSEMIEKEIEIVLITIFFVFTSASKFIE